MNSFMNFKNCGYTCTPHPEGHSIRQMAVNSPQSASIYACTFDELQSTLGGGGKDFGSMNMDEFLKNIWSAEEMTTNINSDTGNGNLQRQGSLTLPRTLSQKTVDQVWRELHSDVDLIKEPQQKQAGLGEMTLEEFLQKAGIVAENKQTQPNQRHRNEIGDLQGVMSSQQPKVQKVLPKQSAAFNFRSSVKNGEMGNSSNGVSRSPLDTSPSPPCYAYGEHERKRSGPLEKVVERRRKRMIKNRESAARSRARKQAYTLELEAEVAKLKELNHELQKKQDEIMESQSFQIPEKMKLWGSGGLCLRRTLTGPW